MNARRCGLLLVVLSAALFVPSAVSAPERRELVRPGRSVGKIALGISEAQLRRVMGRPLAVVRTRVGFGRERVEYQYGALGDFTVELAGPRGGLRVVSVLTIRRNERLSNGFGVGTLETSIRRTYRTRLRCEAWQTYLYHGVRFVKNETRTCRLPGPRGAETLFVSYIPRPCECKAEDIPLARVLEIGVRTAA